MMVPPSFDPSPDFREARAIGATLRTAIDGARPGRVVYLSTIGAQAERPNLLTQHGMIETGVGGCGGADYFSAAGLVHGELQLGRGAGDGARGDSEFPAAAG